MTLSISEVERLIVLKGFFLHFDKELRRTGVTRQLLWEEYLQLHPDGYGYSQFCEHYSRYRQTLPREAVMYLEHLFGERLQVDFAGLSKQKDYQKSWQKNILRCYFFYLCLQ